LSPREKNPCLVERHYNDHYNLLNFELLLMVIVQQRWRHQSLMLRAVRTGDLASLVTLLDSGMDCDQTFSMGGWARPALCLALEHGHTKLVSELCRRRCSVSVVDQGGLSPLQLAASLGLSQIVSVLLSNRAEVDSVLGDTGETALHLATAQAHQDTVRLLLEAGAGVDRQNKEGRTCLMYAARQGNTQLVKIFVRAGARRDLTDLRGNTALLLHCSSLDLSPQLLDVLITPGLPDLPNRDGCWPLVALLCSDHHNREQAVRCLLNRGAQVNLRTEQTDHLHTTPLYLSLLLGNTHMANIFLAAGAVCRLNSRQRDTLTEVSRRWYTKHLGKARSLKQISRVAVRSICTNKLESFLLQAEIPTTLKHYVYFLLE